MNVFLNIKLIARNWWRNKLFFLISLFSLTAGLGCTNLLRTFFIHEYNVEKYNTDRNLIYLASCEEEVSGKEGIESVLPGLPPVSFAIVGEPTEMQRCV